uniref:Uncharacterized protein n=1 Tax=Helicotheca tamesis TaxID=374047 RepID=A0A6U0GNT6_9STRA|mmetsp:Transcript_20096/g.27559  ORF Transcript_20096/g.27559 Transcript_20096/m.27559 type:complete len:109 (+) Transcript_20096:575-901(+)
MEQLFQGLGIPQQHLMLLLLVAKTTQLLEITRDGALALGSESNVTGGDENPHGWEKGDNVVVLGGKWNTTSGPSASVSGEGGNEASDIAAVVLGGLNNRASDFYAIIW